MRRLLLLSVLVSVALFMAGCGKSESVNVRTESKQMKTTREQADPKDSIEYKLACRNEMTSQELDPADPLVAQFRELLRSLSAYTRYEPQRIADMTIKAQDDLAGWHGKDVTLLELMEQANKLYDEAENKENLPDYGALMAMMVHDRSQSEQ